MRKAHIVLIVVTFLSLGACKSREEQLQAEHDKGQFLTEKKAELVKGIGEGLQGKGKEGMQALSQGVGEVFKGAAKGFDSSLTAVKFRSADGLAAKGVELQRAAHHADAEKDTSKARTITAYVVFNQPFNGKLQLRAMGDATTEVGRVSLDVSATTGDAKWIDFGFDERTPVLTADHFVLGAL